jgi:lipopolysaccharide assembly protein A
MMISIIIALAIAIVAVIFALQNVTLVTVSFFTLTLHSSLALVVLVTLAAGVLIGFLASLPGWVRGVWTTTSQRRKLGTLEEERNALKQKAEEMEKAVKALEDKIANRPTESEPTPPVEPPTKD